MAWYAASLFMKSSHLGFPEIESLWEDQIMLIKANSDEDARLIALEKGKDLETEYPVTFTYKGKEVTDILRWTFEKVERICQIENKKLTTGTELFSRFLSDVEARSILKSFSESGRMD